MLFASSFFVENVTKKSVFFFTKQLFFAHNKQRINVNNRFF